MFWFFFFQTCNEMQGGRQHGRWRIKKNKKNPTWSGGRTFGSGKLAAITREQRETRGLLAAGRGACGWGLRKAILIKLFAMGGGINLCYVRLLQVV